MAEGSLCRGAVAGVVTPRSKPGLASRLSEPSKHASALAKLYEVWGKPEMTAQYRP